MFVSSELYYLFFVLSILIAFSDGYNGTIFAFGQTGSGKTHTVSGAASGAFEERGLCYRSAEYLFSKLRGLESCVTSVQMSALEIYNDVLWDLLRDPSQGDAPKLNIVDTPSGVLIPSLYLLPISTVQEASTHLFEANLNRAVAEHQLNKRSSRSHCIYTFYITKTPVLTGSDDRPIHDNDALEYTQAAGGISQEVIQSKLHLVDLAGSERNDKTGSSGTVQKEAGYINRSLLFLERVVHALALKKKEHVPYRQSKLTYLLKDSLGGNCSTYLVACIWNHSSHISETMSTLRFASRMKSIQSTEPVRNRDVSSTKDVALTRQLRKEIEMLRRELVLRDTLVGIAATGGPWSVEVTTTQRARLVGMTGQFAMKSDEEAVWRDVYCLAQMKVIAGSLRAALYEACDFDDARVAAAVRKVCGEKSVTSSVDVTAADREQDSGSVSAGTPMSGQQSIDGQSTAAFSAVSHAGDGRDQYAEFTTGPGAALNRLYEDAKADVKAKKARQKELVAAVNASKAKIDAFSHQIKEDAGNEEARRQLEEAKASYKALHSELRDCREAIQEAEEAKKQALSVVLAAFEQQQSGP